MARAKGDNGKVKTLRLAVDPDNLETAEARQTLAEAAHILRRGGLVAFPTETVYGLGANALDSAAVAGIFAAKQRPAWDPVIVHIGEDAMLSGLVTEVAPAAKQLMAAFWPGPLTLLLPRSAAVPDAVTAGRPLVGVRMPAHPVALALIRAAGLPIAAPSANTFSHTSPTTAQHVLDDLDGRIDAVLDAGPTRHGVESTVLDPTHQPMTLYRPGSITISQIHAVGGAVEPFQPASPLLDTPAEALPSPGVGLRHYAPNARLILVDAPLDSIADRLSQLALALAHERVGILLPAEVQPPPDGAVVYPWGLWSAPDELAQRLYSGLRWLDAEHCSVILCPLPGDEGVGAAIRDRLKKAARTA